MTYSTVALPCRLSSPQRHLHWLAPTSPSQCEPAEITIFVQCTLFPSVLTISRAGTVNHFYPSQRSHGHSRMFLFTNSSPVPTQRLWIRPVFVFSSLIFILTSSPFKPIFSLIVLWWAIPVLPKKILRFTRKEGEECHCFFRVQMKNLPYSYKYLPIWLLPTSPATFSIILNHIHPLITEVEE